MIKYFVLCIILIIIFIFTLFLYINDRKKNWDIDIMKKEQKKVHPKDMESYGEQNEKSDEKQYQRFYDEYDKDMEMLINTLYGEDKKEDSGTIENNGKTKEEWNPISDDPETVYPDWGNEDTEEDDSTRPFTWKEEEIEKESKRKDVPIVDYQIILNHDIQSGSLFEGKEEYLIGKDKDLDIVLHTKDPVVGKKFLRLKPIKGKNLFVLEAVKADWAWPMWSEENQRWEPVTKPFVFGSEQKVMIALTQFKRPSDKEISRLELAMHGFLNSKISGQEKEVGSSIDDDDIFKYI